MSMTLAAGTRVGPYEILASIGAGGMGEVYRARDTQLNREVAIKVLPSSFVTDEEGGARFRREAQVLASLNHPNIASIYGLDDTGGNLALALEFVDGQDLAERLKNGPIPVEEALAIAKQIAEGLEAAHEKGVIHRDLKPANIKITKSGVTKILDFGLAKACEGEATSAAAPELSQTPTIARHRTEAGVILGTAAYMSPEQARGKEVDRRTDIWAFGVVLYEMLTGRRMIEGETVSDTLAAVLTRDPDLNALPAATPPSVRRLLYRCLQRDSKKRLRDIADVYADLEDRDITVATMPAQYRRGLPRFLPWLLAGIAVLFGLWALLFRSGAKSHTEIMHVDIAYPPDIEPSTGLQGGFAISPDGQNMALIGIRAGVRRLYVRRLDRPEFQELNDTAGVISTGFAPDGKDVVLVPGTSLLTRISLIDQQRKVIATNLDMGNNISWASTGVFFNREGALWMVSPQGGTPRQITVLDASRREVLHADPMVLPGDRTVLFSSMTSESNSERIEAVSLETGKRTVLIERAITPVWSPTGHLLFGRDGAVFAVPMDPDSVTLRGSAVPVIPAGIIGTVRTGSMGFRISNTGTLIFVPVDFGANRIITVGRDGSELGLNAPPGAFGNARISPDGTRMIVEDRSMAILALDLVRGTTSRISSSSFGTSFSTWSRDGSAVIFRRFNIPFWVAADGSGNSGRIPTGLINDFPSAPGPDPDSIFVVRIQAETSGDVFLISYNGKNTPKPLIVTPAYEGGPELSPDGHWLLYQSNATGQPEIYVRRYPELDRTWQVSEGSGVQGRWNPNNHEIFYRNGQNMMSVSFDGSGSQPAFGKPTALFADVYDFGQGISIPNYDITRDGRFIMLRRGSSNNLRLITHWTEELKRILAAGGVR